jgi:hypothetical protein
MTDAKHLEKKKDLLWQLITTLQEDKEIIYFYKTSTFLWEKSHQVWQHLNTPMRRRKNGPDRL